MPCKALQARDRLYSKSSAALSSSCRQVRRALAMPPGRRIARRRRRLARLRIRRGRIGRRMGCWRRRRGTRHGRRDCRRRGCRPDMRRVDDRRRRYGPRGATRCDQGRRDQGRRRRTGRERVAAGGRLRRARLYDLVRDDARRDRQREADEDRERDLERPRFALVGREPGAGSCQSRKRPSRRTSQTADSRLVHALCSPSQDRRCGLSAMLKAGQSTHVGQRNWRSESGRLDG